MLKDWLEGLQYQLQQGDLNQEVKEVIYDSRKATPDGIFICMKGTRIDSHTFIPQLLEAGMTVFVTEHEVEVPQNITVLIVKDAREALAKLSAARFGYPAKQMTMVGVTGTKGKTTTTHMMKSMLQQAGKKVGMIGTNGITIGEASFPTVNTTPESYELHYYFAKMVAEGCDCCVMEVSSQAMKMHRVAGITFDFGIFTNISPDHIGPDEHEDFEEYLYYKKQLFYQTNHLFINADTDHFETLIQDIPCKWESFGLEELAHLGAKEISYLNESDFVGTQFALTGTYQDTMRVSIPGKFNVYNALAAIGVTLAMGSSLADIKKALQQVQIDGRMEIVCTTKDYCVLVDYAHNAVSMESLLETLRDYHPKRLVCVFGCGGNRSKDRRYSMGDIAGKMADFTIITADNSRFEKVEDIMADIRSSIEKTGGDFIEIADRREAITYSIKHAKPGDMIAIIGKGHEDYQEIEGVRYPFLDKAVVLEAIL